MRILYYLVKCHLLAAVWEMVYKFVLVLRLRLRQEVGFHLEARRTAKLRLRSAEEPRTEEPRTEEPRTEEPRERHYGDRVNLSVKYKS
jgi:hypothetical protein